MKKRKTSKTPYVSAKKGQTEAQGDKAQCNAKVQGYEIQCDEKAQDDETQCDDEIKGDETPCDVEIPDIDIQDDIGLNNTNTCFESNVDNILTLEEFIKEDSTLNLNSQVEEMKKHIFGLEVLNQAMKEQCVVLQNKNVELVGEVHERK